MGLEKQFPGKDIIYTLVKVEYGEDGPTGIEKIFYIGRDFDKSRVIPAEMLKSDTEFRHRVYIDNELVFEAKKGYGDLQWVSTYDLVDELEKELEKAKNRLVEATSKLIALGQR